MQHKRKSKTIMNVKVREYIPTQHKKQNRIMLHAIFMYSDTTHHTTTQHNRTQHNRNDEKSQEEGGEEARGLLFDQGGKLDSEPQMWKWSGGGGIERQ